MVAMGLDHALRRPSRPGRIDNGGDVVPAERLDATLDLGSNAGERLPAPLELRPQRSRPVAVVDGNHPTELHRLPDAIELEAMRRQLVDLRSLLRVFHERERDRKSV